MKPTALVFAMSISLFACNQSEDKEIGTYDSTSSAVSTKPDTNAASTTTTAPTPPIDSNTSSPDTSSQKAVVAVRNESLQNFWVLETVDGKSLNQNDFPNGMPYFELSLKNGKVSGHAGCNSINGSIKVEANNIVFGNLITTKATCSAQAFENTYVNALSGHKIPYRIEGTKLYLTGEPNKTYVYRKIQQ